MLVEASPHGGSAGSLEQNDPARQGARRRLRIPFRSSLGPAEQVWVSIGLKHGLENRG